MKHLFLSVSPLTESTIQDLSNVAPTRALTKKLGSSKTDVMYFNAH